MCGIAGYIAKNRGSQLAVMLESMEHRGRDGVAFYSRGTVHMGMNRLAINDLRKNPFPMIYKNFSLIFNGEIYNYKFLKHRLERRGFRFVTSCDAEVILPLYDQYGPKAFSKLEGMFAICIYDNKNNILILARDKVGEKPLYFIQEGKSFVFSSELKALIHTSTRQLNTPLLGEYFTQGFVGSNRTLVQGIHKVLPSEYLLYNVSSGKLETSTYWNLPQVSLSSESEIELIRRLETHLESSVNNRLLSDVPVGCFLSGGIDSSLVTLFAAKKLPGLKTFSVSFPTFEEHDESKFAFRVARQLGTDHTEVCCTPHSVKTVLKIIGKIIDDPIVDPAVLPTYLMAHEARKKVKVVLTGEGADELFAGYYRYIREIIIESIRSRVPLPAWLEGLSKFIFPRRFRKLFLSFPSRYRAQSIWSSNELTALLSPSTYGSLVFPSPPINRVDMLQTMQVADFRGYLASALLTKVDRMTMANNLEARAPYLDTKIIELALSLPTKDKIRLFQNKYILRKLAQRHFPRWHSLRPKHGFSVPLRDWFNKELRREVSASLAELSNFSSLFNLSFIKTLMEEHRERRRDNSDKIWALIVLGSWLSEHKLQL